MIREKELHPPSGIAFLVFLVPAFLGSAALLVVAIRSGQVAPVVACALLVALLGLLFAGLFVVNPNEAKVLQLFGDYVGSAREPGLRWANPFYTKRKVSPARGAPSRSGKLKVNDLDGNPVEIAAIVVWKVIDSAQAVFEVDNYADYVRVQSEAALRSLASRYPYDAHDEEKTSAARATRSRSPSTSRRRSRSASRPAGVEVLEARISHLAYAPEIAQAMLQRQQAGAIIAARRASWRARSAWWRWRSTGCSRNGMVDLDEERKAAMVSNLLVVLCGERRTQPVVNTGTLY